ncbi:terminase large subunit [Pectobacterium phage Clickz]|uniref:Terminase large subunit n=8 Tax=Phimunavirus Clickz TaxID=2733338 RepID=A0A3G8FKN2_9CAUD|nr:terminase large subunit [Pectobacterium phage Clickz]AZF94146.1 putative DNA maturase B [Pectobacterium phage Clickz_B2]AZF94160.1 terminase large subunit [Pectobacterium phage Clickz_B3]AZF94216.1 putative DNA maturase B [Pectobacterium phage Clickz_B4]AZF94305.1 terminase large subunit [Pectobacterium phage Clickz_B5]AZF94318.1 putative DNA maturase B [Pectobacterium phage Clickz_B6]AZF94400.1 terminase large subunit [Pectobacterium phage Clickz_B7]AZF94428.1 terminase large subunit [Pe
MQEHKLRRLNLLAQSLNQWSDRPASMPKDLREEYGFMMQAVFSEFEDFADLGMRFLGYTLTPMQRDIARYMQYGPRQCMVAAQRGEAKSTLAALFAVWRLIQDWNEWVLIVSGGETQASEVALLIIQLIERWGILCYLRPDRSRGDRTSYEHYDIHCDLRTVSKSPSVACVGITAQLQGKRATLLIPDDIETTNNSLTATNREILLLRSKEFGAICVDGRIMYLGTPQTKDSIYRTLVNRGYEMRIWPGRIPTEEEEQRYGSTLAPYILELITKGAARTGYGIDGSRGEASDPARYDEALSIEKELEFGPEGYQLQYMLDTSLSDAQRTRIKLSDAIVACLGTDAAPDTLYYAATPQYRVQSVPDSIKQEVLYHVAGNGNLLLPYQHKIMVVDPAGCGGDEVAFACGGALNSYIHLFGVGGLQGGLIEENCNVLLDYCEEFGITDIVMEANMGHGTASMVLLNVIAKRKLPHIGVRDIYAKGQKERRIIDTLGPVFRRHKFVLHERAIEMDTEYCQKYPLNKRNLYSLLFQLTGITYDRGSLAKDDRADAVGHLVNELKGFISVDEEKESEKLQQRAVREFLGNPMGYEQSVRKPVQGTRSRLYR